MAFKTLSIVIPVYNEEKYIEKTFSKVVASNTLFLRKEIIIVNDGSTDGSRRKIKKLASKKMQKTKTIFVDREKNSGKGTAIKTGILRSTGDIVLVQDADLEYSPDDYPCLLQPFVSQNADVVYGSRFVSGYPHRVLYFWHALANSSLTLLSNFFTNLNLTDMETGYKVFRGDLIRPIAEKLKSRRFGFEPEVTARIAKIKNLRFFEVGISYSGRTYQEGKKIGWIDGIKALWEIFRFNIFP
ncbi:glycosyltransferase family 2 protein [Candidatus Roizmanbacteria bacterium]|jgi:glycosyltransferase involved in cell wall biosynthesis|nr:glycosyltransferase family 2 protein [Candidatus Roizmanbacteria bacterium]